MVDHNLVFTLKLPQRPYARTVVECRAAQYHILQYSTVSYMIHGSACTPGCGALWSQAAEGRIRIVFFFPGEGDKQAYRR